MNKPTQPVIEISNIIKSYQMGEITLTALKGINLTIETSQYVAIVGPSGSGKSTLMSILGCLDSYDSGRYLLCGEDVTSLNRNQLAIIRNQRIGFIFQSFNLLNYATALENVCLPLVYRGVATSKRIAKGKQILEQVGLGDRMYHKPTELSGGQQQRVAVARALVTDPDMILADEPTGNLDTQSGTEVVGMFKQLVAQGKTVIVVTHDEELAESIPRVVRIRDGEIVEN